MTVASSSTSIRSSTVIPAHAAVGAPNGGSSISSSFPPGRLELAVVAGTQSAGAHLELLLDTCLELSAGLPFNSVNVEAMPLVPQPPESVTVLVAGCPQPSPPDAFVEEAPHDDPAVVAFAESVFATPKADAVLPDALSPLLPQPSFSVAGAPHEPSPQPPKSSFDAPQVPVPHPVPLSAVASPPVDASSQVPPVVGAGASSVLPHDAPEVLPHPDALPHGADAASDFALAFAFDALPPHPLLLATAELEPHPPASTPSRPARVRGGRGGSAFGFPAPTRVYGGTGCCSFHLIPPAAAVARA